MNDPMKIKEPAKPARSIKKSRNNERDHGHRDHTTDVDCIGKRSQHNQLLLASNNNKQTAIIKSLAKQYRPRTFSVSLTVA